MAPLGTRRNTFNDSPAYSLPVAQHQYWAVGIGDAVLAHRAQKHAGKPAVTATADDEQIRSLGRLHQQGGRMTLDDGRLDGDAGMCFTDRFENLVEQGLAVVSRIVPNLTLAHGPLRSRMPLPSAARPPMGHARPG